MTATPTAKALGKEIEILDWCNESYSAKALFYTGSDGGRDWIFRHRESRPVLVSDEVRKLDREWYKHPFFDKMPWLCDEMARMRKETDAFMLSLGYRHEGNGYIVERPNNDRVALFAHQGFGLEFLSTLLDIPYSQFATRFDMGHSGMTVIEFSGDGFVVPKVLQLSNDSHLYREGLPTDYQNRIRF
jgi:probable phosphoglycerate mutase